MEIIAKPDMRFASLSATEFEIAVSGAMCSLVKECSIKGAESFSDHWVPHVRLIKRNSLQDRTRRVTFKRKNKAGQIEYVQKISRDEGAVAAIANCVAAQTSAPECLEMIERSKQIHGLYGLVRNYVAEMKIDDLSKRAFALRKFSSVVCERSSRKIRSSSTPFSSRISRIASASLLV